MSYCCNGKEHLNRREFIRAGTLTFLGASLSDYLYAAEIMGKKNNASAEACILLWLDGGCSQVDTFDPKPTSSFRPISTNIEGIQLSETLPQVARMMNHLSIIRSMHTEENDHTQGTHYAMTGHKVNRGMKFPSFSSIISNELNQRNNIPSNVMIPKMTISAKQETFKGHIISADNDPLVINDINGQQKLGYPRLGPVPEYEIPDLSIPKSIGIDRLQHRNSILNLVDRKYRKSVNKKEFDSMDTFRKQAWEMIMSPKVREAFDVTREPMKIRERYGMNSVGQSMMMARRLVESGSRFVTAAGFDGQSFDAHGNNDSSYKDTLCPLLDNSLSALLEDLDNRGMLESTIVLVMGEFGRTPDINPTAGRDHWPECWSVAIGGGGIAGGKIVGASDEKGGYVADRQVTMGDLFATIYSAMGIDWHKEYMHPIGRPVKIANSINDETGVPIKELVA